MPESMADDRHRGLPRNLIVLREERPPFHWHHAERGEIIRRRKLDRSAARTLANLDWRRGRGITQQLGENAILLVVIAITALAAWELLWRLDHSLAGNPAASPSGDYVAQERALPEGSDLPYGQGIFVRRAYLPLWATSRLVFAGYCKPEIRLAWPTAKQLTVGCVVVEGSALRFPPPAGITVVHDGGT